MQDFHRLSPLSLCRAALLVLFVSSAAFAQEADLTTKKDCRPDRLSLFLTAPMLTLNQQAQPVMNFQVRRANSAQNCDFWVGFTRGFSSTYDRRLRLLVHDVDYDIFKTPGSVPVNLKTYPEAASLAEVFTGSFKRGGREPRAISFVANPLLMGSRPGPFNVKLPGPYVDSVDVVVFEGSFPSSGVPNELARATQTFLYNVAPLALVSLLDSGAPYTDPPVNLKTLDLGRLETGKTLGFDIVLLYNAGYRLTLSSVNGSRLKHSTRNSFVAYTMKVSGGNVALPAGAPVEVASGAGLSPSAPLGHRVPVTVTIGATSGAWAGSYADTIDVVLTAL